MRRVCCRASVALATAIAICTVAAKSAYADDRAAQADHAAATTSVTEVSYSPDDWVLSPDHEFPVVTFVTQASPSALPIPPALRPDSGAVAPLPPALLLGPLGIGLVGYATYRLRKRI
jgi:hypothetical protein